MGRFPLNPAVVAVLFVTVPVASLAAMSNAGFDRAWSMGTFLALVYLTGPFLLNRVRCPHCDRRLRPSLVYIDAAWFWQRYLYLRRGCPHCGRVPRNLWWARARRPGDGRDPRGAEPSREAERAKRAGA